MRQKKETVYAWIADDKNASKITEEHIESLRQIVGRALAVEWREDGAVALYSSDRDVKERLDRLMSTLGHFQEQSIYIENNATPE